MLIITGSGRCGTSYAARLLDDCGLPVGGAWEDTVRAGFEVESISRMNNAISAAWDSHGPAAVRPFLRTIAGLDRVCLKDPRFVSLPGVLETWLSARSDLRFLVCHRDPRASVVSARRSISVEAPAASFGSDIIETRQAYRQAFDTLTARRVPFSVVYFPECVSDPMAIHSAVESLGCQVDPVKFRAVAARVADKALVTVKSERGPAAGELGFGMMPGTRHYRRVGLEFVEMCRKYCGLSDASRVAEFGCGFGRFAAALASTEDYATYHGFDVLPEAVAYCRHRIASVNRRFGFSLLDTSNALYNPLGSVGCESAVWPTEVRGSDVMLAASVFTHLTPADASNSLACAAAALRPGGRFLSTWFLQTPATAAGFREAKHLPWSWVEKLGAWVADKKLPESAIGYRLDRVESWSSSVGLAVDRVVPGRWSGAETDSVCGQDVVVFRKL